MTPNIKSRLMFSIEINLPRIWPSPVARPEKPASCLASIPKSLVCPTEVIKTDDQNEVSNPGLVDR